MRMRPSALASLVATASGFATMPASSASYVMRWSKPPPNGTRPADEGLNQGLAYAYDADFCVASHS